jgi:hypothetical protein
VVGAGELETGLDTAGATPGDETVVATYEGGNTGGFTVWVDETIAEATYMEDSGMAAYQGTAGLKVVITTGGINNYDVQVKSPDLYLQEGGRYSISFYAKGSGRASVQLDLLNTDEYEFVTGGKINITSSWSKYSMTGVQVPSDGIYFWAINLGLYEGTFYFDEFTLSGTAPQSTSSSSSSSTSSTSSSGSMASSSNTATTSDVSTTIGTSSSSSTTGSSSSSSGSVLSSGNTASAAGSTGLGAAASGSSGTTGVTTTLVDMATMG